MISKRRVLINHLVAEVMEKLIKNDEIRVNYFVKIEYLLQYA